MSVFITGLGVTSALGCSYEENLAQLKLGNSGLKEHVLHDSSCIMGCVPKSNLEIVGAFNLSNQAYSRSFLLGLCAAYQARTSVSSKLPSRMGLIVGITVGGMDLTEASYQQYIENKEKLDWLRLRQHPSGMVATQLAQFLEDIKFTNTISTACSSGANAIMHGAKLIEKGKFDCMLVGGVDALTQFTIKGFQSLMLYDKQACKPFDEARNGLNLGEGSAFLLLESERSQRATGNKILAKLVGWANTNDAYHATAPSPVGEGATRAMSAALKMAGIAPEAIGYINAHGTGTLNNDLSESRALLDVFSHQVPPFSSTKSFTGHTLGAAGAIEAAFCVMALQQQQCWANLNFTQPITDTKLTPISILKDAQKLNFVLSNSFGFGGNNTSLVMSL